MRWLDLRIGQESGLVLAQRLRAPDEHTRIAILMGYPSIATAVEAIKLGAVHYLTRPADAVLTALRRHAPGTPSRKPH